MGWVARCGGLHQKFFTPSTRYFHFLLGGCSPSGFCYFTEVIILPINLHLHARFVDNALFALVDADLVERAKAHRWVAGKDNRPVRSVYDPQTKNSTPESLARWVWRVTKDTPPPRYIAHFNGDLLDARSTNLIEVKHPSLARSLHTGEEVLIELTREFGDKEPWEIRAALGLSEAGSSAKRGKPCSVSKDQIQQLLDARLTVGRDLSLKDFNAEVCSDVCGKKISPLLLSKILRGHIGRVDGFDYSTIRPFRVRR